MAWNPLGGLAAFGGALFPGMEAGVDLTTKFREIQAERELGQHPEIMQAILEQSGLGQLGQLGRTPPSPGEPSQAGAPQMPTLQAPMAPMVPGMQMPQAPAGGFAAGLPGAQQLPQQPGGAQPPGVPPMQVASAGGDFPTQPYVTSVKGFEGYAPRAQWDYKQYSGGYGTRARPGETFTEQSASSRLQDDLHTAAQEVDKFAPGLPQGPRSSLTSLTMNTGIAWQSGALGRAVKEQNWPLAEQLMQQYVRAGGRVLPGLQQRRLEEARWMSGQPPSPGAIRAGEQAQARAQGTQVAGPGAPSANYDPRMAQQGVTNLRKGDPLSMPQLAQLIERNSPNVDPGVKFLMMKKALGLMNQSGQTQFNNAMQILNYQERLRSGQRAEEREIRQQHADERRDRAQNLSYLRADKEYQGLGKTFANMLGQDTSIDNYSRTAVRMGEQLVQLANQKSRSGLPVWQAFTNAKGAITGDPLVDKFRMQLMGFRSEVSRVIGGSPMSTAMTEGVRREGEGFLRDSATARQVQGVLDQFKVDVKIRKQESKKTLDNLRSRMRKIESGYNVPVGAMPEPEIEPEPEPTTGAGTSTTIPSGVTITPIR